MPRPNSQLNQSRGTFSTFVIKTLKTYTGKKWSQNTIRAIKVSSVWKDSIKTIEALKVSEEMAHDPRTALVYYRDNAPDNSKKSPK